MRLLFRVQMPVCAADWHEFILQISFERRRKKDCMTAKQGKFASFLERKQVKISAKVYFIDAMGAMALGLFATLLMSTILGTLADLCFGEASTADFLNQIANYAKSATGMAIGVAIAHALKAPPLVLFSCSVVGAMANAMGATIDGTTYAAGPAVVFSETVIAGSSTPEALYLAAGAAAVGCCCQMVGFAAISFRENRFGGLIAQGLGTSMLQMGNIVRKPIIWLPAIFASAVCGALSTTVFKLKCAGVFAGMGTCGVVGPIGILKYSGASPMVWVGIILLCVIGPVVLSIAANELLRKLGLIKSFRRGSKGEAFFKRIPPL